ncbi:hypothetical protein DL768_001584 [Monosporascus sp. mg162]|nr:hypothetical protein DL768_001584 [Monosporascus sp. mg162]
MDPFRNFINAPAHNFGAAGQPSVTDVGELNNNEIMAAWDHLKLQVNSFNAIVSIHAGTFGTWSVADKNLIVDLMKQEVQQEDIRYAVDINLPDRVYIASTFHFNEAGIVLHYSSAQALPVRAASDAAVDSTNNFGAPSYVNDTTGANSASKPRNKSKAPASGIRRPRNSWILYRSARQAQIIKTEGPMPNGAMSTRISREWKRLAPAEKKRWEDLAEAEKLEHARKNPHYKYQPRRRGEIKRRNTTKTASLPSITSPATSSVTLNVAGTSGATPGAEDDMIGDGIAVHDQMSAGELMAHYAIYNSPAPVVSGDGSEVPENLESAIQSLLNNCGNPAVVFGRETNVPDESAAGIHYTFNGSESSFGVGPLLNGNVDSALHEYQPPISESPFDGGSDHDSLFGDYSEEPGYDMTANDWVDIMNKANFSTL